MYEAVPRQKKRLGLRQKLTSRAGIPANIRDKRLEGEVSSILVQYSPRTGLQKTVKGSFCPSKWGRGS